MLLIFAFLSLASTLVTACLALAILNVIIRRGSATIVENEINLMVEMSRRSAAGVLETLPFCGRQPTEQVLLSTYARAFPRGASAQMHRVPVASGSPIEEPWWMKGGSFAGLVSEGNRLEVVAAKTITRFGCTENFVLRIPLDATVMRELSIASGLRLIAHSPHLIRRNGSGRQIIHIIDENFVPGSSKTMPVVLTARNWQTGVFEDWAAGDVRPSYAQTLEELRRIGSRNAKWLPILGAIALALVAVYACGLILCVRLSQQIVWAIDALGTAATQVGAGNFSYQAPVRSNDQLGAVIQRFNAMTKSLRGLREIQREKDRLDREMELAREVQQYLYPRTIPTLNGASVAALTSPARVVSGDLYDFFGFTPDRAGLLCVDISGKGVSAALMMSNLQALARNYLKPRMASNGHSSPAAFASMINDEIRGRFGSNRYGTMFYGEFDSTSRELHYVNAGHPPPLLISPAGAVTVLRDGDLPVGMFAGAVYQNLGVKLTDGSALVVYTDGVTDAPNRAGETFGEKRLISFCGALPPRMNAKQIAEAITVAVSEWANGCDQFDDVTVLVLVAR
jgi:serine phosphatase RsbU (regulator of sigma subunit)